MSLLQPMQNLQSHDQSVYSTQPSGTPDGSPFGSQGAPPLPPAAVVDVAAELVDVDVAPPPPLAVTVLAGVAPAGALSSHASHAAAPMSAAAKRPAIRDRWFTAGDRGRAYRRRRVEAHRERPRRTWSTRTRTIDCGGAALRRRPSG